MRVKKTPTTHKLEQTILQQKLAAEEASRNKH